MPVRKVLEGVFEISLAWSNAYLLTEGGEAALVDTGLRQDRPRLLEALAQVGVAPEQVRAVYLTHAHCDHAGNAALFAQRSSERASLLSPQRIQKSPVSFFKSSVSFFATDDANATSAPSGHALLYAHREEAPYLEQPRRTYIPRGWRMLWRPLTALTFAAAEWRYPVVRCGVDTLLTDGDIVEAPGGMLRVVATPGHTAGHVAYFRERDGLLFSGDAVLSLTPHLFPARRLPALSLPLGFCTEEWEQAKRSAQRLAELNPALLLSGHGWPLVENTACRLKEWAQSLR